MSSKKAISRRKLLKLQDKLEAFDLRMQEINLKMLQYEFDLLSFCFEMRKEAKQPLVSPEVDQSHEGNEVDNARKEEKESCVEDVQEEEDMEVSLDLPQKFDEYEDNEGACEVVKEEAIEQQKGKEVADSLEEVEVKIDEGEMLTLSTSHP